MWAFLMIHLCDKMPDAIASLGYILIVIEVDFFFLEDSDQAFCISVLPWAASAC